MFKLQVLKLPKKQNTDAHMIGAYHRDGISTYN